MVLHATPPYKLLFEYTFRITLSPTNSSKVTGDMFTLKARKPCHSQLEARHEFFDMKREERDQWGYPEIKFLKTVCHYLSASKSKSHVALASTTIMLEFSAGATSSRP